MKALIAAALISTVASQAPAADPAALCHRLAAQARTVKDSAWGLKAEDALRPALQIDQLNNHPSAFEAALATLPTVKEAVGAEDGQWTVFTDHLPGTNVYSVSTVQGTLHCQTSSFLQADNLAAARIIAAPITMGEGDGPCWTQSGAFGRLYGQPAFFVHGTVNDHSFDTSIMAIPWMGGDWVQGCEVDLKFRTVQRLVERHCDDQAFCGTADVSAKAAAEAYSAYRAIIKNNNPFQFGPQPPASVAGVAARWAEKNTQMSPPDFPMFGSKTEDGGTFGFSYSGLQFFPLNLQGQWFIAAIGHDGVGWRESGRTLLAIYAEQGGALTPKAGFVFDAVNGGLIEADMKTLPPPKP